MHYPYTHRLASFAFLVLLLSAGMARAQSDVRAAIEAANAQWMAKFHQADSAGLAALYTANGQLFPANSNIVSGTQAIARFWQGAFDAGIKKAKLVTIEAEGHGDTAHEVGTYTLMGEGDTVLDSGKYVVVWKRQDGQWKLHRDIWNTSQPASKS
jgi:uncharacterized protein (TIGR02246 family)